MTILVTGGAGFIGSNFVLDWIAAEGARARAARGDLDGARAMLVRISRFDTGGRLLLAELALAFATQAGDNDGVAAETARLRLLRKKADLEHAAPPQ